MLPSGWPAHWLASQLAASTSPAWLALTAKPCQYPKRLNVTGVDSVCEAPPGSDRPFTVTVSAPVFGFTWLEARIAPSVTGLKLLPFPNEFEYLLPGELDLVSSKKASATMVSHRPLLQ